MKSIIKALVGMVGGALVFMLAMTVPGLASAEAYTVYNNSGQTYANYNYSTSYTNYRTVNYTQYAGSKVNNASYTQYNNYQNYQQPSYNTQPQTQAPTQTAGNPGQTAGNPGQTTTAQATGVSAADEQAMVNFINKERVAAGLQPLTADAKLTELARLKAQDMIANNYFGHTSPTYGSPFDLMKNNGVTYRYAGENLAGAPDVNTANTNLINSPGHKANILKPEYTKVGVGVVNGGPYGKMFVQLYNG